MSKEKDEQEMQEMQEMQEIKAKQEQQQLQEEQQKASQKKFNWMDAGNFSFKFLGHIDPTVFKNALTEAGITAYEETQDGFNVNFGDNNAVNFDNKNNTITVNKLDRGTFTKMAEVAMAAGIKDFDFSPLLKSMAKDGDKLKEDKEKLYQVYAGVKDHDPKCQVQGIGNLLSEFDQRYEEEKKNTVNLSGQKL